MIWVYELIDMNTAGLLLIRNNKTFNDLVAILYSTSQSHFVCKGLSFNLCAIYLNPTCILIKPVYLLTSPRGRENVEWDI